MAVADFNWDGHPDLVAAQTGNQTVTVLLGGGDGTFHGRSLLADGPAFQASTAIADVDRDGTMDLVTGNTELGKISIALGNGDGSFRANDIMLGTAFDAVAVGDFDEDGWLDVAAPDLRGPLAMLLGGCGP